MNMRDQTSREESYERSREVTRRVDRPGALSRLFADREAT